MAIPEGQTGRESLIKKIEWLQHLQLTNEQIELVKQYRCLVDIHGFGFWEWNYTNQTFHCHGQLCLDAGYSQEEMDAIEHATEIRGLFYPDDLDRALAIVRQHVYHNSPIHFSFRMLKKCGEYMWVTTMATSLRDENNRITNIVGVIFDASQLRVTREALRTAELRLQRIMNASNDGIWEWSAKDKKVEFSDRVLHHLGFKSIEQLVKPGESTITAWMRRIHPEDLKAFKVEVKDCLTHRKALDFDYRIADRDGIYRWVRTRAHAKFNQKSQPVLISGTNIDITEIKLAQERLENARDQAEKANLSKSKFLSGMSQQLRTPMNAILGYAQLFEYDDNLTDDQRNNMHEVRKAGEHLIQLIDDVLDLSKIESGNITLANEPILVSEIVKDCITLSHPQANKYNVTLTAETGDTEPLFAECDRVRLKQVLLNLISNGIKYNRPSGWVNINVFFHNEDEICISVEDNGFGISEDKKDKLFQPFNRLGAEKTAIEGSGVGLVITKRLIEMMGGDISFYSQEGVGSCFEIYLKRCDDWAESDPSSLGKIMPEERKIHLSVSSPKTVLYIEDNPANIRLMEKLFRHVNNIELEIAQEPLLGVYKTRLILPDLILLDLEIPGFNGHELLEILSNDPSTADIPVVALSTNKSAELNNRLNANKENNSATGSHSDTQGQGSPSGSHPDGSDNEFLEINNAPQFYSYLVKPWNIEQIIGLLENLFGEKTVQ